MMIQRTDWLELFFERFAGKPLTVECVFRSPKYLDQGIEKEVCDFLLVLRDEAILVSMKCQSDSVMRADDRLERWVIKAATGALKQAKGAMRTLRERSFWCEHPRRQRVDFNAGALNIRQLVVLVEVFGDSIELKSEMPLSIESTPITYLSVNDFCNLVNELRAFPDISAYLNARRSLPAITLRTIGEERPLFQYYLLNGESFVDCLGREDARIVAAAREYELRRRFAAKVREDKDASIIEYVSDALAERMANYTEGLDDLTATGFDHPERRRNYLLMQDELCDLRLSERRLLGTYFLKAIERVRRNEETEVLAYGACHLDSKPNFIYVVISAKGKDRANVIKISELLLRSGMAAYGKTQGMTIADREGKGFEVMLACRFKPRPTDIATGQRYFANLKMSHVMTNLLP